MGLRFRVPGWGRELEYEEYLQTAQWRRLREAILERAGGMCEHCLAAKATQVHHRTYDRLGWENPEDLVALCATCHRKTHAEELPPVYPYNHPSAEGWPFPWATLVFASLADSKFRTDLEALVPIDSWPEVAKVMLRRSIDEHRAEALDRLKRLRSRG